MTRTSFFENSVRTVATNICILFLALAGAVVTARLLGPSGKGLYSLSITFAGLVLTFTNLGITASTSYLIAKKAFGLPEVLGNTVFLSLFTSLISVIAGALIAFLLPQYIVPGVPPLFLALALLAIPFHLTVSNLNNIFLGLNRIKHYNAFSALRALSDLAFVVLFVYLLRLGVQGALFGHVLSAAVVCSMVFAWTYLSITKGISMKPDPAYLRKAINYGFRTHISNILVFLFMRFDLVLVNWFLNPAAVGLYGTAAAISNQLDLVPYAIGLLLFPKVASQEDDDRKKILTPRICRSVLLFTLLGAGAVFAVSEHLVVFLFSQSFYGSVAPLKILVFSVSALSVWRILSNDIAARGFPEYNIAINLMAVLINISLNIVLIPSVGIQGAALASFFSCATASFCALGVYCRLSGNKMRKVLLVQPEDLAAYSGSFRMIVKRLSRS